jgi:RimJ/RimL family protein N-acetyltransferase
VFCQQPLRKSSLHKPYVEGDDVEAYTLDEVQAIYRTVSQTAFCFVIETDGRPIGEGWLQEMNLARILQRYPSRDSRRTDLMIGEEAYWGLGLGTAAIRLLTAFAFDVEGAGLVFACDVADDNVASRRAFEKAGYTVDAEIAQPPGAKAHKVYDLVLRQAQHQAMKDSAAASET